VEKPVHWQGAGLDQVFKGIEKQLAARGVRGIPGGRKGIGTSFKDYKEPSQHQNVVRGFKGE